MVATGAKYCAKMIIDPAVFVLMIVSLHQSLPKAGNRVALILSPLSKIEQQILSEHLVLVLLPVCLHGTDDLISFP
jgi:hypothetical protein